MEEMHECRAELGLIVEPQHDDDLLWSEMRVKQHLGQKELLPIDAAACVVGAVHRRTVRVVAHRQPRCRQAQHVVERREDYDVVRSAETNKEAVVGAKGEKSRREAQLQ
eukprot:611605-Prymnesium_polylepis.1